MGVVPFPGGIGGFSGPALLKLSMSPWTVTSCQEFPSWEWDFTMPPPPPMLGFWLSWPRADLAHTVAAVVNSWVQLFCHVSQIGLVQTPIPFGFYNLSTISLQRSQTSGRECDTDVFLELDTPQSLIFFIFASCFNFQTRFYSVAQSSLEVAI